MADDKKGKDDKVFDIAKPGKTAATPQAKPVIVGHKSLLKDPMVKEEGSVELTAGTNVSQKINIEQDYRPSGEPQPDPADAEPGTAPTVSRLKINPIESADDKADKAAKKSVKLQILPSEPEPPEEDTAESTKAIADSDIKDSLPDEPEAKPETTDLPVSDQKMPQNSNSSSDQPAPANATAAETQKKADKEAEEAVAKQVAMEKLIADRKYFVPIGQKTRKKRSLRNMLLGTILILVLGALLVDVLLDAGLVHYHNIQAPIKVINR